jgi:hypothetical protein
MGDTREVETEINYRKIWTPEINSWKMYGTCKVKRSLDCLMK